MECASLSRTSRSPTMVVAEHAMTVSKPAGWRVAVVVLRYGCYDIPDADSGAPCGQQVFGAHNDVGAGARGKPAGADRE